MAYTTIDKSDDYFNTVTYTGNGSTRSITGVNFQPDWVWIKVRSTTYNHRLYDVVRGVDTNYYKLFPNLTIEQNTIQTNELTSLNSDGFTLGSSVNVNNNGSTFVAWNLLGGGTGVSNTDGSITSTVSANPTAGFSIVSYTGTGSAVQIGHGLNSAPQITIIKRINANIDWVVYTDVIDGSYDYLFLNTTAAKANTTVFSSDSDTFNFSTSANVANVSSSAAIAYCFHSVKGYSKMGTYTGNGSTNGTFVYTGFKPAFVMAKRTNTTGNWFIHDSTRDQYNPSIRQLQADNSSTEYNSSLLAIDLLSNGYKLRNSSGMNASGSTYLYMAFAENPFVTSTGIPACAR
jgi:hypothetical protein